MKKLSCLFIFTVITVFTVLFVSCAADAPEVFNADFMTGKEAVDLDGFKFTFSLNMTDELVLGYFPESLFAESVYARLAEVEKKYNCEIKRMNAGDKGLSFMTASLASGSFYCDAIMATSWHLQSLLRVGSFVGISTLSEFIDYKDTAKWGMPNMLESLFWNDDLYGVLPASWPELLYGKVGYAVLVNENLIAKMGATDPREYVETKTWTWDKFEEVLAVYTQDINGVHVYGMSVHPPHYGMMFALSNGTGIIEKDANGNYICGFYTENGKAALQRGQEIFTVTRKECFYPDGDNDKTAVAFLNGEAVLHPTWASNIIGTSAMSYQMDNLGLIHFPQGPKADPDVYPSVYEGVEYSISIPINSSDIEASAMLINAIFEPLPGYETEELRMEYMLRNSFFDPRDAEIFLNMFKNTRHAFYYDRARLIPEAVGDTTPISKVLESYKKQYDEIFETVLIPVQKAIDALWGDENPG